MTHTLSIGITTKDRPGGTARVRRVARAARSSVSGGSHLRRRIDGSCRAQLADAGDVACASSANDQSTGYIAGRNRLVAAAGADFVLLLDDDTRLLTAEAVESAIETMRRRSASGRCRVRAGRSGRPAVAGRRCSRRRATRDVVVASFIGFAHLLRRSTFPGDRRVSRVVRVLRRREGVLPAAARRRVRDGLPAGRARRARSGSRPVEASSGICASSPATTVSTRSTTIR